MKKAFTLVETMLVLSIIGVMFALMIPTVFSSKPDESTINYRRTFFAIEEAIRGIINDDKLYPLGDLRFPANAKPTAAEAGKSERVFALAAKPAVCDATCEANYKLAEERKGKIINDSKTAVTGNEAGTKYSSASAATNPGYRLCHHLANALNTIGEIRCPGETGLTTRNFADGGNNMVKANINFKLSNGATVGGIIGNWEKAQDAEAAKKESTPSITLCIDTNGEEKGPNEGCKIGSRAHRQRDQYRIRINHLGKVYTGASSGGNNWFMENLILINPKVLADIKSTKKLTAEEIGKRENLLKTAKGEAIPTSPCPFGFTSKSVVISGGTTVSKCVFTAGYGPKN